MKLPHGKLPADWPWLALSVVLHVALLVFLLVNREPVLTPPAADQQAEVIQAHVLDATRLEEEREAARAAQRAREQAERQRAQERARQEAEAQAQREAEAQRQREAQAQRRREAEQQRQREAEEKARREAEQQRQREAEAQRRREAEAEAQRQREAEERARREAEEKARQEREAAERRERELAEALDREAQARQQRQRATELDRARSLYVAAIRDRIRGNWRLPSGESEDFECRLRVTQAPGGQVLNVRILQSCGSSALDRSVESAVLRSSPLPSPPDPDVFARDIEFVFRPR